MIGSQPGFLDTYTALAGGAAYNSVSSFIYPSLLNDQDIMGKINQANIYNWTTTSPVSLVYMRYDSTVTNLNSAAACSTTSASLKSNSAANLVNCIVDRNPKNPTGVNGVDNSNLWTTSSGQPTYMTHGNAEGLLQLVALHQMLTH